METAPLEKLTLHFVYSDEVRPIEVWESLYKNVWLFIEVTEGNAWEGYQGKLIATADDPIEFVELGNVGTFIAAPEEHWI